MTNHHQPDDLDLTPRSASDLAGGSRNNRRRNWIVGLGLVAVLGFLGFQALSSARVYYYNVDEAVADRADLGDGTFRMQGNVVSEPSTAASGALLFQVGFNDETATVRHIGAEPTDLFDLGVPVVVEGHWDGDEFVSNQILVKHSEEYIAENGDRAGVGDK